MRRNFTSMYAGNQWDSRTSQTCIGMIEQVNGHWELNFCNHAFAFPVF